MDNQVAQQKLKMSKTGQDLFTQEEAVEFLQTSWNVKNVLERLKNDRKNLLNEVATLIHGNVPFQSISLVAAAPEERTRPSFKDIKERCKSGIGGICYEINTFTCGLLKALGFAVCMACSTVTSMLTSPDNHAVVLVSNLEQDGDLYLVDCGSGFSTFRAVSLDFAEESPVYQDSFLEYKYIRHEGKILRMHGKGDMIKRNNPPIKDLDFFLDRWRRFYSFIPEPYDAWSEEHYKTTIVLTPFTSSPRAVWFPRKHAVIIVNNKLMVENEAGELLTTVLKSDEEIMKAYKVYFPQLKQDTVQRALAEWHHLSKS